MARARTVGSIGAPGSGTSGTVSVTCEPPLGQAHGRGAPALQRRDLEGVLDLCRDDGWPSLPADPARADRILTNPGVTTYVAVDGEAVAGFAARPRRLTRATGDPGGPPGPHHPVWGAGVRIFRTHVSETSPRRFGGM